MPAPIDRRPRPARSQNDHSVSGRGLRVRPDRLSPAEASAAAADFAGGRGVGRRVARPVFLDRSGTRRRLLTVFAAALGCGLFGALTLLVLAFSGASPVPIPGFPQNHPATNPPAVGPGAQAG